MNKTKNVRRKDSKGRVLQNGESQRVDGRYLFQYVDVNGERRSVYSWRFVPTDRLPKGRRDGPSLRELEKDVLRDVEDGIDRTAAERMTIADLMPMYRAKKKERLRSCTMEGYESAIQYILKHPISNKPIGKLKPMDIRGYISTIDGCTRTWKLLHLRIIKDALNIAVENEILRKNPASVVDRLKEHDCFQYSILELLLYTGIRAGEICGLKLSDIDAENRVLKVERQIQIRPDDGRYEFSPPKSKSSVRSVPLDDEAMQAIGYLTRVRREAVTPAFKDVLLIRQDGLPYYNRCLHSSIKCAIKKYNRRHETPAPKITAHILRHTYCTRMVPKLQPKTLQYIMGHESFNITYSVYTDITKKKVLEEVLGNKSRK